MGAKYFQEIVPLDAVDCGEIVNVGFSAEVPAGEWNGCIEINDTNPTEVACESGEDVKIYCPGVGLVQDQELELVWRGFVDRDADDDDDNKRKMWGNKWNK